jgi:hypothetical protein
MRTEDERAGRLLDAQANAVALFDEVVARGIIAAGLGEQAASDQIRDLANEMFGKTRHWHKRIVRSGPHTVFPYRENPPDRVIAADDIVFADFGPIFEEFEADLGRTYVLGDDPVKHRLAARSCTPRSTGWPGRPAGPWAAGTPVTSSASSRTRRSTAPTSSHTSPPATARPCTATTRPGGCATGSWRSTSPTPPANSAASTSNSLTWDNADDGRAAAAER